MASPKSQDLCLMDWNCRIGGIYGGYFTAMRVVPEQITFETSHSKWTAKVNYACFSCTRSALTLPVVKAIHVCNSSIRTTQISPMHGDGFFQGAVGS